MTVSTPSGYSAILSVCKTVPLPQWVLETDNHLLVCVDFHLVVSARGILRVCKLRVGDQVRTADGIEEVKRVHDTGRREHMYDLEIDTEDHLYYTDGILSHNSTGLGIGALFDLNIREGNRALYLAPMQDHVKTFADKLRDMERGSIFSPDVALSKNLRNNLFYKESETGGSLRLMHVLSDVTKVRGQSIMKVMIDEAQDFDPGHLPEIAQAQRAFPDDRCTIFAGTSKDIDTCLETQYQAGSRGVWHIRGHTKGDWYSLNDPDTVKKILTVDGLVCPKTSKPLNPLDGEFVHEDRRRLLAGRPSFHLPQLIVPKYAAGQAYQQIWQDSLDYSWDKFLMEVMGIPVAAGLTELGIEDLKRCCDPDVTFQHYRTRAAKNKLRYKYIVSGCDWGGSDFNMATRSKLSYTVHVVYGVTADGRFDLLHAHKYSGMKYDEIAGMIVHDHNFFKASAIATDNGAGHYYNAYLADCGRIPKGNLIVMNYTDNKLFLSRIDNDSPFNLFSLHRSDSISSLIQNIRDKRLRFPRWDLSKGFLEDILNIRRNITENPSGRGIMRYIKAGNRADDFMQATNFALTLAKAILGESIIANRAAVEDIRKTIGGSAVRVSPNAGLFGGAMGGGAFTG